MRIQYVLGREILDSRGNPTLEATVILEDGAKGTASVPSGASTGIFEAVELRDGNKKRYGGKGVLTAVNHINGDIRKRLIGKSPSFTELDRVLCELDGTDDKSVIGANAILAVSVAAAKASAASLCVPLYRYLGGMNGVCLPIPMMNILNGGAHAANNLDVQEFMIVPDGFSCYSDALRAGTEIYHALGKLLKNAGKSTTVGDEGGYAPDLDGDDEAIEYIMNAIEYAGYSTDQVKIALDAASSEWFEHGKYTLPKAGHSMTSEELIQKWAKMIQKYPIISIEDGVGETDSSAWRHMTDTLGDRIMLVGDDLFVTNPQRLRDGIHDGLGNAVLVKPNQVGTLSESLEVIRTAQMNGYGAILSHRSGDTGETMIADIAVATNAGYIKTGAPCRYERVAKYNRLLRIEAELGRRACYGRR